MNLPGATSTPTLSLSRSSIIFLCLSSSLSSPASSMTVINFHIHNIPRRIRASLMGDLHPSPSSLTPSIDDFSIFLSITYYSSPPSWPPLCPPHSSSPQESRLLNANKLQIVAINHLNIILDTRRCPLGYSVFLSCSCWDGG